MNWKWFRVVVDKRASRLAHLFATSWESPESGYQAACGLVPGDYHSASMAAMQYAAAGPADERCPACAASKSTCAPT